MSEHGATEASAPLQMNYTSYEIQIVCKWGVVLEGFTEPEVTNPGNIGTSLGLNRLVNALRHGHCYWKTLDDSDWQLRIDAYEAKVLEGTAIKRKRRNDAKGDKQLTKKRAKTHAAAADSCEEDIDEDINEEEEEEDSGEWGGIE